MLQQLPKLRTPNNITCRGVPLRILDCHHLPNSMGNSCLRLNILHGLGKVVGAIRVSLYFNAKLATARVVCLTCEGGHKYGGIMAMCTCARTEQGRRGGRRRRIVQRCSS